jgi:membrane protease YdiL (CAAX protease family)
VVLGRARGKTGSLVPSILLHSAGNAVLKLGALIF